MIKRYWSEEMKALLETSERKFALWRDVEIAVLRAREELGQIPEGSTKRAEIRTRVDKGVVEAIERRDLLINHDLNAFVEVMRAKLIMDPEDFNFYIASGSMEDEDFHRAMDEALAKQGSNPLAGYFHDGMTSYDTEEPAMGLLLRESCAIIEKGIKRLIEQLTRRAQEHRGTMMIGRTHGQHAQPITFGVKLLGYRDMVLRGLDHFQEAACEVEVMKLSGAVGMYGTLGPDIEQRVAEILELDPVFATQIVPLDRRARLVNEMALMGSVVGKIAFDFWLMCQTEVSEIREPFSKSQKGSSAMPHKKNPITLEKIEGLSRLMGCLASAAIQNVATIHERDISHSSVERLAGVDAFGVLDHMLINITRIIEGMEVFPERMLANLDMTYDTIASQRVEMWLKECGMPAEAAYRKVQAACATAMKSKICLMDVIDADPEIRDLPHYTSVQRPPITPDWKDWLREEDYIYKRAGL